MTSAIDDYERYANDNEGYPQREYSDPEPEQEDRPEEGGGGEPQFILYLDGPNYGEALNRLNLWVRHLLLPVYGREVTSSEVWCSRWWEHREAVAQFYALWMAWQEQTGAGAALTGPANWHRDYLGPTMTALRDPSGPFAGCKPGSHRAKESPYVDEFPG